MNVTFQPIVSAERIAQLTAHRACCGGEHDPANGKLHGCCVVCGVPWPCEYAGEPPHNRAVDRNEQARETIMEISDRLHAERCETAYEILSDLLSMESEKWAIGGGPGWKEREAAIWKRARELFEP